MKNLKRVSCTALVCVLLSVLFVMPSYAAGFGGGSRPGSFGSGGFGGATAQTCISYDALSDLCVDLNARLANGDFGASWKSYGCTIVKSSDDFYVIRLIVSGTTYYFRNASGGVYYTTERPSLINSIYGQLWSTYNGVRTDIAVLTRKILERMDTITPIIEGLPGYLWGTYNGEKADIGALAAMTVARLDTTNTTLTRITNQLWSTYDDKQTEVAVLVRKALQHMDAMSPVVEALPSYLWGTYKGEKTDLGALTAMILTRLDKLPSGGGGLSVDLTPVITSIEAVGVNIEDLNTNFSANLDSLVDKFQVVIDNSQSSVDNVTSIVIDKSNNAFNVFYLTGEDGTDHSIGEVTGNTLSASGKLLNFLYKLCVEGSLSNVDKSISGLNDFYFDNGAALEDRAEHEINQQLNRKRESGEHATAKLEKVTDIRKQKQKVSNQSHMSPSNAAPLSK